MRGIGGEKTISLLISAPKVSVRSLLYMFPIMLKNQYEERMYKIYITDTVRAISETVAKHFSGPYAQRRYIDTINPNQPDHASEQTYEQIVDHLKAQGIQILNSEEE